MKTRSLMMKKCRNLKNEIKTRWGDSMNLLYCSHIINKSRRSHMNTINYSLNIIMYSSRMIWLLTGHESICIFLMNTLYLYVSHKVLQAFSHWGTSLQVAPGLMSLRMLRHHHHHHHHHHHTKDLANHGAELKGSEVPTMVRACSIWEIIQQSSRKT